MTPALQHQNFKKVYQIFLLAHTTCEFLLTLEARFFHAENEKKIREKILCN